MAAGQLAADSLTGFSLSQLETAAALVHQHVQPTPQYSWPLLSRRLGCEAWLKHENHTRLGAFKMRGGIVYLEAMRRQNPGAGGLVAATRGNHGQSLAFAARQFGWKAVIVAPHGNSEEKNAAMQALGAELLLHGKDFQEALEYSAELAMERGLVAAASFDPLLVLGVSSYALEMFRGMPEPDLVYVPVGMGSGICGVMAARDALGLKTAVVGVVSKAAPAYAMSFRARMPVAYPVTTRIADGMACRKPDERALEMMWRGVERMVEVSDEEIEAAMRALFSDTHNTAEGAGAAALAAATREQSRIAGKRVALVLSGGNVDRTVFARVLGAG
ncbi:MAG: threonine dehydratase [Acidobacteria bacterium]|nr:threonine dehydratase [Acidobacteriota bacterium]